MIFSSEIQEMTDCSRKIKDLKKSFWVNLNIREVCCTKHGKKNSNTGSSFGMCYDLRSYRCFG